MPIISPGSFPSVQGDAELPVLTGGGSAAAAAPSGCTAQDAEADEGAEEGLVEAVFGGLLRSDVTCLVRV